MSQVEAVASLLRDRQSTLHQLKSNLAVAQNRMKLFADAHRSERQFNTGDWVYLKLQPYRQVTVTGLQNQKLSPRFYGPYEILKKIGTNVYRLNLPVGSAIHPVCHIFQLKLRIGRNQAVTPNLPVMGQNGSLQSLSIAILARCMVKKRNAAESQVLIQWTDQEVDDATWESYNSIAQRFSHFILEVEKL